MYDYYFVQAPCDDGRQDNNNKIVIGRYVYNLNGEFKLFTMIISQKKKLVVNVGNKSNQKMNKIIQWVDSYVFGLTSHLVFFFFCIRAARLFVRFHCKLVQFQLVIIYSFIRQVKNRYHYLVPTRFSYFL